MTERAMSQQFGKLRTDTDKKALDVLTADQKKSFEGMKGKIIELRSERGRGRTN